MTSLLNIYTLVTLETTRLLAEVHRVLPTTEHCQARIELKLSPQLPVADSVMQIGQIMHARLGVVGLPPNGREEEKLFTLEVAMNAIYRPLLNQQGQPLGDISFEAFNRGHTSLTRQLFPVLERRAHQLLLELGLSHIHLPIDLVHEPLDESAARNEAPTRTAYH
jgi:hypothetical protein